MQRELRRAVGVLLVELQFDVLLARLRPVGHDVEAVVVHDVQRELLLLFRRVVDLGVLDAVIVAVGVVALVGTLGQSFGLVLGTASACGSSVFVFCGVFIWSGTLRRKRR